ncbi:M23 family metallopeptidase [Microbacterium sp. No. 7]|uniref:M23 family metallopeptidase n=1 Tax=Microbacterium sp. No. 7 TaxID=1714373 RepID=UPI0006CF9D63|nr:M23 family metallopeptidase [Microbacterium sp. No. 7]
MTRAEYRRFLAAQAEASAVVDVAAVGEASPAPGTAAPAASVVPDVAPPNDAAPRRETPAASGMPPTARSGGTDLFEAATRLFAAAAELPSVAPRPVAASSAAPAVAPVAAPRRGHFSRQFATGSLSVGAMSVVGLLAFSTMVPMSAVASATQTDIGVVAPAAKKAPTEIQAFVSSAVETDAALDRPEQYGVASMTDLARESGITSFSGTWVNNPSAEVQWPFPVGVPISASFADPSYAQEFGTFHKATDLTPGNGAEVHAVAGGTVRIATESGGEFGVTVLIDHVIDGELVSTRYAHMQYGSLQVSQGDTVKAGQVLGKVGSTGKSTGPHLHLEVLLNGTTPTDPMVWIAEHTTG